MSEKEQHPMTPQQTLGQRLRAWRMDRSWSIADVALQVFSSAPLIQAIEEDALILDHYVFLCDAIEALITPPPYTPLEDATAAAIAEAIRLIRAGDDIEIIIRRCRSEDQS